MGQRVRGLAAAIVVVLAAGATFAPPSSAAGPDTDGDGVVDAVDRCPAVADPVQLDADLDGIGDACDPTYDNTYLTILSDGDGFLGEGLSQTWYPHDGPITAAAPVEIGSPVGRKVQVDFDDGGTTSWHLVFAAPVGTALAVGEYTGATASGNASSPGLTLFGSGKACGGSSLGDFDVLQLSYAGDGSVQHLAADFAFNCNGELLYGGIRFKADGFPDPILVGRVYGDDRIETAIAASQATYRRDTNRDDATPTTVVLARSDSFADALAGTPLAAALDAPLLLTGRDGLDDRVRDEIVRLLPAGTTVRLLGGTAALGSGVETGLVNAGFPVKRIAGADRYATAVAIAGALGTPRALLLATGTNFPDGLAAGAAAARVEGAVLLTDGSALPAATAQYLTAHPSVPVAAIGGPAAAAAPGANPVVGANRYDTSARVAAIFFAGVPPVAGLASGENFPDALAGGANIARMHGPLLLTPRGSTAPEVADYLHTRISFALQVYGGPAAVDDVVLDELFAASLPLSLSRAQASGATPAGHRWLRFG